LVNNEAKFVGLITANNVTIDGQLTSTGGINLQDSSGKITIGIVTTTNLKVGSGSTILATSANGVGIGTLTSRANLDIEGHTRLKSYSENVGTLTVESGNVVVDLSEAQSFTLTPNQTVTTFKLKNIPDDATSFTIKINQNSSPQTVGLSTFAVDALGACLIKWPGGVIPVVSNAANATDIYSFKVFDGAGLKSNPATGIVYGIVGGQNFS
jgi:hypothetical protein